MIDKAKLLDWINDKKYIHEGPYEEFETDEDIAGFKGSLKILNWLEHAIENSLFDVEVEQDVWKRAQVVLGKREE